MGALLTITSATPSQAMLLGTPGDISRWTQVCHLLSLCLGSHSVTWHLLCVEFMKLLLKSRDQFVDALNTLGYTRGNTERKKERKSLGSGRPRPFSAVCSCFSFYRRARALLQALGLFLAGGFRNPRSPHHPGAQLQCVAFHSLGATQ